MAGVGPMTQDWEPVVIRKKTPNAAAKRYEKTVNAARRSGAEIESVRKYNAGTNKAASSGTSLNTKRLDDDTENLAHERVSTELKKAIMQARGEKKLTQSQLAQVKEEVELALAKHLTASSAECSGQDSDIVDMEDTPLGLYEDFSL